MEYKDPPSPLMRTLRGAGSVVLSVLGWGAGYICLLGVGLAMRDAFCYPGFPIELMKLLFAVTLFGGLPLLGASAMQWGLISLRLALAPLVLGALAVLLLWIADTYAHTANKAVCAAGHPEVQDNLVTIPTASTTLAWLAAAAALAGLLASALAIGTLFMGSAKDR